jgi:hypothetical protein
MDIPKKRISNFENAHIQKCLYLKKQDFERVQKILKKIYLENSNF